MLRRCLYQSMLGQRVASLFVMPLGYKRNVLGTRGKSLEASYTFTPVFYRRKVTSKLLMKSTSCLTEKTISQSNGLTGRPSPGSCSECTKTAQVRCTHVSFAPSSASHASTPSTALHTLHALIPASPVRTTTEASSATASPGWPLPPSLLPLC